MYIVYTYNLNVYQFYYLYMIVPVVVSGKPSIDLANKIKKNNDAVNVDILTLLQQSNWWTTEQKHLIHIKNLKKKSIKCNMGLFSKSRNKITPTRYSFKSNARAIKVLSFLKQRLHNLQLTQFGDTSPNLSS